MAKKLLSPRQPRAKSAAGALAFGAQNALNFHGEICLSRLPVIQTAFSRLRDVMVSENLKLVYFPIPKSACTMFATLIALQEDRSSDYDPALEGVHGYRFRTDRLRLKNANHLTGTDYFKFTVLRNPYTRLVSAYLDKLVKPLRSLTKKELQEVTGSFPGNLTFEALIKILRKMPDHAIEKHWRPQYTFFRNVHLDYIGCFERLDHARTLINRIFNIDMQREVEPKVFAAKRTKYSAAQDFASKLSYAGNVPPRELALLEKLPNSENFYCGELDLMIKERYALDFELHSCAMEAIDFGNTVLERRYLRDAGIT